MSLGYDKDHVIIAKSGDVLELNDEHAQVVDHVQTGAIFVDGLGVGDVGNIVLRDRQNLDAFWEHECHDEDSYNLVKIRGKKSQRRFFQIYGCKKGERHSKAVKDIQLPAKQFC